MERPTILMPGPMMDLIREGCEARFDLVKLWQADDVEARLAEAAPRVRGIATGGHRRVDAALMDRLPLLEIVSNFGVGYDTVDVEEAARRGILVTNTPDVLTDEVADTALGLLIMTARRLSESERYLRAGRWTERAFPLTEATLRGRTLGIVGLGRIGKAIATRAEGFGLAIAYHGRSRQADVPYRYYDSLVEMARAVDTLMVVTPGGPETRHLIDRTVLEALGPDGILINIARGSVVDERALIEALRERKILSVGLDVFEDEPHVPADLMAMEHVVLLPHVASASLATRRAMAQLVVDNLVSWFDTGRPLTPVPETPFRG